MLVGTGSEAALGKPGVPGPPRDPSGLLKKTQYNII